MDNLSNVMHIDKYLNSNPLLLYLLFHFCHYDFTLIFVEYYILPQNALSNSKSSASHQSSGMIFYIVGNWSK